MDFAKCGGGFSKGLDRLARRHVDRFSGHLEGCVLKYLGSRFGILPAHVSEDDMLADPDAAGNGLADLSRSYDNYDVPSWNSLRSSARAS